LIDCRIRNITDFVLVLMAFDRPTPQQSIALTPESIGPFSSEIGYIT